MLPKTPPEPSRRPARDPRLDTVVEDLTPPAKPNALKVAENAVLAVSRALSELESEESAEYRQMREDGRVAPTQALQAIHAQIAARKAELPGTLAERARRRAVFGEAFAAGSGVREAVARELLIETTSTLHELASLLFDLSEFARANELPASPLLRAAPALARNARSLQAVVNAVLKGRI